MVDFKKLLNNPPEKFIYTYQCVGCAQKIEYVVKLPPHLQTHGAMVGRYRPCKGLLVLIDTRPDETA